MSGVTAPTACFKRLLFVPDVLLEKKLHESTRGDSSLSARKGCTVTSVLFIVWYVKTKSRNNYLNL